MVQVAATGGTFDIIHQGHLALLQAAFRYDHIIIGLSTDDFAKRRGKTLMHSYEERKARLENMISKMFAGIVYEICPLDDDFGPAVLRPSVDILVVSEETRPQGRILNEMRHARCLEPVDVLVVPMVHGADGTRISTTKIRSGQMSSEETF